MCEQDSKSVRQRARKRREGNPHRLIHTYTASQSQESVCTHGPCGRLGGARLLEGHLKGVKTGVVGVGGDGRGRRQALEGGVGLGVWWGGGHGRRGGVLGAVGAGGRRAAPQALHAAAQQVVLGLWREEEGREWGRRGGREGAERRREGTGRDAGDTGAQREVGLHRDGRVAGSVWDGCNCPGRCPKSPFEHFSVTCTDANRCVCACVCVCVCVWRLQWGPHSSLLQAIWGKL